MSSFPGREGIRFIRLHKLTQLYGEKIKKGKKRVPVMSSKDSDSPIFWIASNSSFEQMDVHCANKMDHIWFVHQNENFNNLHCRYHSTTLISIVHVRIHWHVTVHKGANNQLQRL
jgi:hypothetical protein